MPQFQDFLESYMLDNPESASFVEAVSEGYGVLLEAFGIAEPGVERPVTNAQIDMYRNSNPDAAKWSDAKIREAIMANRNKFSAKQAGGRRYFTSRRHNEAGGAYRDAQFKAAQPAVVTTNYSWLRKIIQSNYDRICEKAEREFKTKPSWAAFAKRGVEIMNDRKMREWNEKRVDDRIAGKGNNANHPPKYIRFEDVYPELAKSMQPVDDAQATATAAQAHTTYKPGDIVVIDDNGPVYGREMQVTKCEDGDVYGIILVNGQPTSDGKFVVSEDLVHKA